MAMNVWNGQWLKGLSCSGWDLVAVGIIVLVILAAIWIGIGLIRGAGQRRLDRVMSSSLTTQVFLFLSFNAVMVVFAVAVGYLMGSNPWNVITAYTFGNLEHLPTPGVGGHLLGFILTFAGVICMGGLLISTLTNIISRRAEKVMRGEITYKHIKDHYVVVGYSQLTESIIHTLYKKEMAKIEGAAYRVGGRKMEVSKVLLLTNQNMEEVRRNLSSTLDKKVFDTIIFYSGFVESREQLQRLNIDKAKEIYLLGEYGDPGTDTKNIEAFHHLADLRGDNPRVNVHVHFETMSSYATMQKLKMPDSYLTASSMLASASGEVKHTIYFRPFNFYELWAGKLWRFQWNETSKYRPLDNEVIVGDTYVHLVIVELDEMGTALLLQALRMCHYPNYTEVDPTLGEKRTKGINQHKTKITIIDPELYTMGKRAQLESHYPYINLIEDIEVEFVDTHLGDPRAQEIIARVAQDVHAVMTIVINHPAPDEALSMGLNLPEAVYYQKDMVVRNERGQTIENRINNTVLVRQELKEGLSDILDEDVIRFNHVYTYGMGNQEIDLDCFDDLIPMYFNADYEWNEWVKQAANQQELEGRVNTSIDRLFEIVETYKQTKDKAAKVAFVEHFTQVNAYWGVLLEKLRWSNRYTLDVFGKTIRYLKWVFPDKSYQEMRTMLMEKKDEQAQEVSLCIAKMNKMRWNAEKLVAGYRPAQPGEVKDNEFMIHPLIIPFYQMLKESPEELDKDDQITINLLFMLEIFEEYREEFEELKDGVC